MIPSVSKHFLNTNFSSKYQGPKERQNTVLLSRLIPVMVTHTEQVQFSAVILTVGKISEKAPWRRRIHELRT